MNPMKEEIQKLIDGNRAWSEKVRQRDPDFFPTLSKQQAPTYMWIGCSDSRVPANEVVGMMPGEIFVHRNVANVVVHTDLNCLSVMQFAVEVLKVRHIIVTGHYGCGGVRAALQNREFGLIDNWLRNLKDIYSVHKEELDALEGEAQVDRLCELNVCHQVRHVCHTNIVQQAWRRGQSLAVHGWCYGLTDGLVNDLNVTVDSLDQLDPVYHYRPLA